ncbi:MAG: DUF4981 domain-containing protein, partial [Cyclobacteriaceae bacterium]|nr:DUF4981 domain-containing protein [Cyclobacteriaceae bacterium HetDA_MAG_MS6]
NECGTALVHSKMASWTRAKDPTRLLYHQNNETGSQPLEGDASFADVNGERYPTPAQLDLMADTTSKPIVMGEYFHAMGNGSGHLDEYWEVIYDHPSLQGGYIWDWVNQGLEMDLVHTPDASSNNISAFLSGKPQWLKGKHGQGVALSGIDDWVEVYNDAQLNLTGDELTIEAWIYPRGFYGSNSIVSKGRQYELAQFHADSIRFGVTTVAARGIGTELPVTKYQEVKAFLPVDWNHNWHHVAGIMDGNELSLILDGKRVARSQVSDYLKRSRAPVCIGKNHTLHDEQFNGFLSNAVIDEVAIHKKARNLDDLGAHLGMPMEDENTVLLLHLDTGIHNGKFLSYGATPTGSGTMDGIVFSNRQLQPEAWQIKKSHQPFHLKAVDLNKGLFSIENRYHFSDFEEMQLNWMVMADGLEDQGGDLSIQLSPGATKTIKIPFQQPTTPSARRYHLIVEMRRKESSGLVKKGAVEAFEEFPLPWYSEASIGTESQFEPIAIEKSGTLIKVIASDAEYIFNEKSGMLESASISKTPILSSSTQFNVWRTPVMNEWSGWGISEASLWYEMGLDSLVHELDEFATVSNEDGSYTIKTKITSVSHLVSLIRFKQEYDYHINPQGQMRVKHRVRTFLEKPGYPVSEIPWLPVMGLKAALSQNMDSFEWSGPGPFETYPDRKTGARSGLYSESIGDLAMPYIIPQDFGNHTDVNWVNLRSDSGIGVKIVSDQPFNFKINPYANLDEAWYPFQLQRKEQATFHLDYLVTGLGGTSIPVQSPYRVYSGDYTFHWRIEPLTE